MAASEIVVIQHSFLYRSIPIQYKNSSCNMEWPFLSASFVRININLHHINFSPSFSQLIQQSLSKFHHEFAYIDISQDQYSQLCRTLTHHHRLCSICLHLRMAPPLHQGPQHLRTETEIRQEWHMHVLHHCEGLFRYYIGKTSPLQ